MSIKYFIEEEDMGNFGHPLVPPNTKTEFYDDIKSAERIVEELDKTEICFCIWKFDTDSGEVTGAYK